MVISDSPTPGLVSATLPSNDNITMHQSPENCMFKMFTFFCRFPLNNLKNKFTDSSRVEQGFSQSSCKFGLNFN
jgi:hypothetical protein